MPDLIHLTINGTPITVQPGTTVAVALTLVDTPCRTSVTGQPRAPLCAMGICFECRATIDGIAHRRTCQLPCANDMEIRTA